MYKYIMTVAIVLMGLLQFTSCNDANDWAVDPSVKRQYAPTSLKMELDLKEHKPKVTFGQPLGNTKKYELQMSLSPLYSNADIAVEGEIFTRIYEKDIETDKLTLVEDNFPRLVENNIYYFRARAISEDGSVSKWYTNGSIYNGGVTDASLEKKLIAHTAEADPNKNSVCVLEVPPVLWDIDTDVDYITVRWHEIKYAEIAYLRITDADGNVVEDKDASNATLLEETYSEEDDTKLYELKCDGLEKNKDFNFSLLDADKNEITSMASATEETPNMDLAMSITIEDEGFDKAKFVAGKKQEYTVTSNEVNGKTFTVTFKNNSASGWTVKRNDWVANPVKQALSFNNRGQLKANDEVEVELPCEGRLYIYGYVKNGRITGQHRIWNTEDNDYQYVGKDEDSEKSDWTIYTGDQKNKIPRADVSSETVSAYVSYHKKISRLDTDKDKDGKETETLKRKLKIGATSVYFYGFCFVPDK